MAHTRTIDILRRDLQGPFTVSSSQALAPSPEAMRLLQHQHQQTHLQEQLTQTSRLHVHYGPCIYLSVSLSCYSEDLCRRKKSFASRVWNITFSLAISTLLSSPLPSAAASTATGNAIPFLSVDLSPSRFQQGFSLSLSASGLQAGVWHRSVGAVAATA